MNRRSDHSNSPLHSLLQSFTQTASVIVTGIGCLALIGWLILQGQRAGFYGTELGLALIVTSSIVLFFVIVLWTAQSLNRADPERKQAEERLRQSQVMFQGLFEFAPDAIVAVNREGSVILLNGQAEELFGYRREEIVGKPVEVLIPERFRTRHAGHRAGYMSQPQVRPMGACLDLFGKRKDGTEFPVDVSLSPVKMDGETVVLSIIRNITDRKAQEVALQYQAAYDGLTDLPNRIKMHEFLGQAILTGQRENKSVAFLLMDLDRFREINDTLGHSRGDFLLKQIGPRLMTVLRPYDRIARMGGDEFAVLLPLAESGHATLVARKIMKGLEPPFMIEGLPIAVEVSIGIALYPDHGADADTLIQRADVAMYAAKQSSMGYVIYDAKIDQHSPRRLALMGELRHAIEHNQLFLHYQPKISLKTGRVIGVEALVRWQHSEHGFIPPDQFIGPAEQTGLIKPLTLWVFSAAQRECLAWHQAGMEIPISVNLSARTLHDPQLPDLLSELIQTCSAAPDRLMLEITENAIMADPERAIENLTRLKAMGIRFAIDDFGTGYSSLGYLKKLPVDEIKIDKSFVIEMVAHKDSAVIVCLTIDLAHNLGLMVVAEGVENKETLDRLVALGCDAAQGYYMCRPLPATELTRWLRESPWGLKDQTAAIL